MELQEQLIELRERAYNIIDSLKTEEATKTSLVMPFFKILGYDIFNPMEFIPEFVADVGMKKGEKIDYAIFINNQPLIFIECKCYDEDLAKHQPQLFRYYSTTSSVKFGILTDGVIYQFFTDLDNENCIDSIPFFTFNLLKYTDRDVTILNKFSKEVIDVNNIVSSAEMMKYTSRIKDWFSQELDNPSQRFVKFILSNLYDGVKTQNVIDKFTPLVKKTLQQSINDMMNSKIKDALNNHDEEPAINTEAELEETSKIETTLEELETFGIIKSILRPYIDVTRISYKDTETYFGVLLDNNTRKWICRIKLNRKSKSIIIPDENKTPIKYEISSLDDIYKYSDILISTLKNYLY